MIQGFWVDSFLWTGCAGGKQVVELDLTNSTAQWSLPSFRPQLHIQLDGIRLDFFGRCLCRYTLSYNCSFLTIIVHHELTTTPAAPPSLEMAFLGGSAQGRHVVEIPAILVALSDKQQALQVGEALV